MDEQKPTDPQPQRSNSWLLFSILCAAGSVLAYNMTQNKLQWYKAQQESNRQQMEKAINELGQHP
jgi:hypothetical protein